jgi:3-dehydroquinate dehydratase-2
MKKKVLLINGPNLNLLGTRETNIYGSLTLEQIVEHICKKFAANNIDCVSFQSNSEGKIVDFLHQEQAADFAIINPAAYSHTSIAIHDAFLAVKIPFIEVHISNIYSRESFRHHSYLSAISKGVLCGFGVDGYEMAADFVLKQL